MCQQQEDWFDSQSEGPFTTEEVIAQIRASKHNHYGYHLTSHPERTFEKEHPELYAEITKKD